MTDRDKIRAAISIQDREWEEHAHSLSVRGGAKYIFLGDGTLKSIITRGRSYGPDGENEGYRYLAPKLRQGVRA